MSTKPLLLLDASCSRSHLPPPPLLDPPHQERAAASPGTHTSARGSTGSPAPTTGLSAPSVPPLSPPEAASSSYHSLRSSDGSSKPQAIGDPSRRRRETANLRLMMELRSLQCNWRAWFEDEGGRRRGSDLYKGRGAEANPGRCAERAEEPDKEGVCRVQSRLVLDSSAAWPM